MSATQTQTAKPRGRVKVETGAKRVRAYLGGEPVADTTGPLLVWEKPYYPTYYFPVEDVRTELLEADGELVAFSKPRRRPHLHRPGGQPGSARRGAPVRGLPDRGAARRDPP